MAETKLRFRCSDPAARSQTTRAPPPALAYRFDVGGRRIVVSGDQNLDGEGFIEFARDADLLVMPFAIPESAGMAARNLHATPSRIGRTAAAASVKHLVLSHFMARSLDRLKVQLDHVREHFDGKITLAEDLQCLASQPQ